jgi:hypothetical protein
MAQCTNGFCPVPGQDNQTIEGLGCEKQFPNHGVLYFLSFVFVYLVLYPGASARHGSRRLILVPVVVRNIKY